MFEIIPNWHPMFVHFTVASFSTACGLYVLAYLFSYLNVTPWKIVSELEIVGRWSLWLAAFITVGTVLAGLYAFNTVRHDEAAHIAMTIHRKWALTTAAGIVLLAIWSGWHHYKSKKPAIVFVAALLVVQCSLLMTAWLGGELVYRYGLGVQSLPKVEGEGHHHHDMTDMPMNDSTMPSMHHDNHDHSE